MAAISTLGGGGVIFNIFNYIKNQYSEDKFYGLLLIIILAISILILFIYFIRPLIEWHYIDNMHKREIESKSGNKKFIRSQFGKIIYLKINNKLKQEESDDVSISEIIDEFNDVKED